MTTFFTPLTCYAWHPYLVPALCHPRLWRQVALPHQFLACGFKQDSGLCRGSAFSSYDRGCYSHCLLQGIEVRYRRRMCWKTVRMFFSLPLMVMMVTLPQTKAGLAAITSVSHWLLSLSAFLFLFPSLSLRWVQGHRAATSFFSSSELGHKVGGPPAFPGLPSCPGLSCGAAPVNRHRSSQQSAGRGQEGS